MTPPNKFLSKVCPRYEPEAIPCKQCAETINNNIKHAHKNDLKKIEIVFQPDTGIVVCDELTHTLLAKSNKVIFTKCSPFCG